MSNEVTVRVGADIQRYRQAMADVVSEAKRTSTLVATAATGMGGVLQGAAVTGSRAFSSFFSGVKRQFEVLGTHLLGIRTALAGLVGGFFLVRFIKQFVDAGQEMENFQIQLNAVFRGADILARDALRNVIEFARVTPFTTQETIQAFTMLRSVGFDVTNDVLEAIGNTAFVFHRRMTDVAMAMVSMETETLRRLGVVLDRTGEKARIMSGGVTKVVENTREAIFAGLVSLFQEIFPGAMKDAENTFRGAMANLFSLFEEFRYRVGAAVTGQLVPRIQKFIVLFEDLQKSGVIGQLEKDLIGLISNAVLGFADMIEAGVKWVVLHKDDMRREVTKTWEGFKKLWEDVKSASETLWGVMKAAWDWYMGLDPTIRAVGIIAALFLGPARALALAGAAGLISKAWKGTEAELDEYVRSLQKKGGEPQKAPATKQAEATLSAFSLIESGWEKLPKDLREWLLWGIGGGALVGSVGGIKGAMGGAVVGGAGVAGAWSGKAVGNFLLGQAQAAQEMSRALGGLPGWGAGTKSGWASVIGGLGTVPNEIDKVVKEKAAKYALDPNLVRAVIKQESQFNVAALSSKGAMGLMQIMPEIAQKFAPGEDPFNIESNIEAGTRLLRELLDRYSGNLEKALAAYNAGLKAVAAGVLPEETKDFLDKVLTFYGQFTSTRPGTFAPMTPGQVAGGGTAPTIPTAAPTIPTEVWDVMKKIVEGRWPAKKPAAGAEELPLLALMENMEKESELVEAMTRDATNKLKLQASNAEAMIKKQKDSIDDVIESTMIELKTATLVGGALIEQKTALEGQLAITKAIREAKEKEQDRFGKEQEDRIRAEMSAKYAELARVRVQAESSKNIVELIKGQRESIENLLIEVQTAEAITEEERVQAELAKIKLDLQRKGLDFAKDLTDEQQKTTEQLILQGTRIKDILERYQDLKDTIQEAFTGAVRNIQSSFADMWYNVFSGGTKKAKDFLREIADSFLKAVSQIQGAITAALIDRAVVAIAGALGFPNITSIKGLISTTSGSMARSFIGGGGWGSAPPGVEGPVMEGGGFFSNVLGWLSSFFGEGGIMPGMQLMPVRHFAAGGIVDQPMVGFVGENAPRQYEAVVPLKDNRYIPVQLGGGGGEQGAASRPVVSVTIRGDIRPEKPGMTKDEVISVFVDGMKHDTVIRQTTRESLGRLGD